MKRIFIFIIWIGFQFSMMGAHAGEYARGSYVGGQLGFNDSSSTGKISAPKEETIAYILQGGYLQWGYIFDARTLVFAAGTYLDLNPSEKHGNGVTYGSRGYGINAKVGLPLGFWMPYAKLGYGYSTGTRDLEGVTGNSINGAVGVEYKIASQWSVLGEYKSDAFGSNGTSIKNKTFMFGFNYYFNAPEVVVAKVVEEEYVEEVPVPVAVPIPVTDAPPI